MLADWAHFPTKLFNTFRSAGETSSTERDTSGPSARHGSEGTDPKAKKEQDGAARSTEEEGRYKLKNPIVWMDLEMTGALQITPAVLPKSKSCASFWSPAHPERVAMPSSTASFPGRRYTALQPSTHFCAGAAPRLGLFE